MTGVARKIRMQHEQEGLLVPSLLTRSGMHPIGGE